MSETSMSYNDECFRYRTYNRGFCSVLCDSTAGAYRELGFCNTMECPFYKPRRLANIAARVGDHFVPYTREQLRIADSFRKSSKASIKF